MFVNYAHRGASEYAPENTMSSFYLGLTMKANGIETDVQKTKDGKLVLFHDDTLIRVTGEQGCISDYTYDELMKMRVRKNGLEDKIVLFEDFLRYFGFRDLTFAIELKESGFEKEVIELLDKYEMCEKTVITSFIFDCIKECKRLAPRYKVGWLNYDFGEEEIENFSAIGGEQLCPQAVNITPEKSEKWHAMGYGVRAWGISDTQVMEHAVKCGVDGMTVNFPDKLTEYLAKNRI